MNNTLKYFLSFFTSFVISYALCGLCIANDISPIFGVILSVIVSLRLNQYIRESEVA